MKAWYHGQLQVSLRVQHVPTTYNSSTNIAKDPGKRVQSAVEMDILGNYNGIQVIIYIYMYKDYTSSNLHSNQGYIYLVFNQPIYVNNLKKKYIVWL